MRMGQAQYTMMVTLSVWVGLIGACKGKGSSDTTSGTAQAPAPADTGKAPADIGPSSTAGGLSDANIVALLDEANKGDSAAGAFALRKAANPEVKAFAKLMMGEHHALRMQGLQLAKKLNVTPQPPANDPVQAAGQSEMAALTSAPKGAQFDRTYIDQEVAIHKAVMDLAEKAHGAAQNGELKALIEKAKPVLQKHLDRAEEIQKKLSNATT
jgi:putative membrane protein